MSTRYTGGFIRIVDITVTEDSTSVFADNQRYFNIEPVTTRWRAVYEGTVLLENLNPGFTTRIVRHGETPQEAVDKIQDLVDEFGWKVLSAE